MSSCGATLAVLFNASSSGNGTIQLSASETMANGRTATKDLESTASTKPYKPIDSLKCQTDKKGDEQVANKREQALFVRCDSGFQIGGSVEHLLNL